MSNDPSVKEVGGVTSVQIQADNGLVTYQGTEMPREVAEQHGWVDPTKNQVAVHSNHGLHQAPAQVGPDGVPMEIAVAASQEFRDIVMNADHQMLETIESDFMSGDEQAEDWMIRNAPNMVIHGWERADNWCAKLGVDADTLSSGLIDQETKTRMLKAIFTGDESMFQRHIAEAKQSLLAEMLDRGMENFELNGHIPDRFGNTPIGNVVDLLLAGQLDIEEM